jgi:hypothetical protein
LFEIPANGQKFPTHPAKFSSTGQFLPGDRFSGNDLLGNNFRGHAQQRKLAKSYTVPARRLPCAGRGQNALRAKRSLSKRQNGGKNA